MEHLSKILLSRSTHHQHHREPSENSTSSQTTHDSASFKMSSDNQSPVDTPPSQSQEMDMPAFPLAAPNEVAIPKKRGRPAKNKTSTTASAPPTNTILGDNKVTKSNKNGKKNPPGRRKKAKGNAKAQARFDRMFALKRAYRELAFVVKPGLQILLDRSLKEIEEKPSNYKRLPQYQEVEQMLQEKYEERAKAIDRETEVREAYLVKQYDMQTEYDHLLHYYAVEDAKDKALIMAKKRIMQLHPHPIHRTRDAVPYEDDDLRLIEDDEEPERPAHVAKGPGFIPASSNQSPSKKLSPSKRRAGNDDHLGLPLPKRPALQRADHSVDQVPMPVHRASIFGDIVQTEGTPVPPSRGPSPETTGSKDADRWGVIIPNKVRRGRGGIPNNRAIVPAWFSYDEHEIGRLSKDGKVYLDNPTKEKFSELNEEDFDQEEVRKHKLHPKYGIPIGISCHPTDPKDIPPPTDFSKGLPRYNPIRFVTKDGRVFDTSRSARLIYTERDWEIFMSRVKMGNALKELDAEEPFLGDMVDVQREQQAQADQEDASAAVSAILDAASQVEVDELVAKKNQAERDAAQLIAPPPAPPQSPPRHGPGSLLVLAEAANAYIPVQEHVQIVQQPQPQPQPQLQPQQQPQQQQQQVPQMSQPHHHQQQQHHQIQQPEYAHPPQHSQPSHQHQHQQMDYAEAPHHTHQAPHPQAMQPMQHVQEVQQIHHPQQQQQQMSYTYPSPSAPIPAPMVGYNPRPQPYLPPILPPPQMMGPTYPPFPSNPHFSPPMNQSRHRELRPAPPQGDHPQRHYGPPPPPMPAYNGPVVQPGYPGAPPPQAPQPRHPSFSQLPPPPGPPAPGHYQQPDPWNWYPGPNSQR